MVLNVRPFGRTACYFRSTTCGVAVVPQNGIVPKNRVEKPQATDREAAQCGKLAAPRLGAARAPVRPGSRLSAPRRPGSRLSAPRLPPVERGSQPRHRLADRTRPPTF